ncbi:MAG: hypothetical protein ACR2HY_03520 [Acidimicrobiales bacterium]
MSEPQESQPAATTPPSQPAAELEQLTRAIDALLGDLAGGEQPPERESRSSAVSLGVARLRRQLSTVRDVVESAAAAFGQADSEVTQARSDAERVVTRAQAEAARLAEASAAEASTRREATNEFVIRTRKAAQREAADILAAAHEKAASILAAAEADAGAATAAKAELDALRRSLADLLQRSQQPVSPPVIPSPPQPKGRLRHLLRRRS